MRRPAAVWGVKLAARLAVLLVLGGALSALAPAAVRASGVVFEEPQARAVLGQAVSFWEVFRSPVAPLRVELVTRLPGAVESEVRLAEVSGEGPAYRAAVEITEHVRPNTSFVYHLRVTLPGDAVALGPQGQVTLVDDRFDWRTARGQVVTIHWYEGSDAFGRSALRTAEDAATEAAGLLGLSSVERMDYFIYGSSQALYEALGAGTQGEVGGQYFPPIRTAYADIAASETESSWAREVVAHEVTHHVFEQATRNPYHQPPTWLNEGLAVFVAEGGPQGRAAELRVAVQHGAVLPLEALTEAFPRVSGPFSLAYAESVSAVDFLLQRYGHGAVADLARLCRAGASDDEAFEAVTGGTLAEFDAAWLDHIGAPVGPAYGPQPAPAGPLPRDWQEGASVKTQAGTTRGAVAGASWGRPGDGSAAGLAPSATANSEMAGLWPLLLIVGLLLGGLLAGVVVVERHSRRERWR
jgi:hypothetical protein